MMKAVIEDPSACIVPQTGQSQTPAIALQTKSLDEPEKEFETKVVQPSAFFQNPFSQRLGILEEQLRNILNSRESEEQKYLQYKSTLNELFLTERMRHQSNKKRKATLNLAPFYASNKNSRRRRRRRRHRSLSPVIRRPRSTPSRQSFGSLRSPRATTPLRSDSSTYSSARSSRSGSRSSSPDLSGAEFTPPRVRNLTPPRTYPAVRPKTRQPQARAEVTPKMQKTTENLGDYPGDVSYFEDITRAGRTRNSTRKLQNAKNSGVSPRIAANFDAARNLYQEGYSGT